MNLMTTDTPTKRLNEIRKDRDLRAADLTSVDALDRDECEMILDLACEFRKTGTDKLDLLRGVSIALAFFESSTRTRSSFEWAGKQLGADTINVGSGTAEKKGESLIDVAQTLDSMGAKAIVLRTSYSGLPEQLAKYVSAAVINAGDGWHEHPSQALIDLMTIVDEYGDIEGKTVTIVGDIKHSRVFGSLARILKRFGAEIRVAAPLTLIPEKMTEVFGTEYFSDVEQALPGSDVVYALRVQNERGATGEIPTLREYSKAFGISPGRFALANKGALLMHPGPIQRDIDVHHALAAVPQSRILRQIENGPAIRKAILWLLCTRNKPKSFVRV